MEVLLSTTYFGPVQWYQKLHRAEHVQIERWESFQKQTYRNRCLIATTQGIQALTVPVVRGETSLIKDLLQSAYGESPFFEYYQDDIRPFFQNRWEFLLDFNEAIREKMCELIDIQPQVSYTEQWVEHSASLDYREAINPKHPAPDADFVSKPYYQVYQQKHGFLSNLSILDLLFNMGPEGIFWL